MIAVDINDVVEVHAAGLRVLRENLGPDVTMAFLNLTIGGKGDWTKEKYDRPDMTEAEMAAFLERAKADTAARRGAS
ncbi:MAG: hypothetical protein FWC23_06855 [Chitinispirillia bacterium]|nr:hypothetical protein [Chitinispirillia bacterium]MCL2268888.1 hypothetical protein [Chitinispirillia bacterium]